MSSATHEPVRRGATPWPRLKFAPMGQRPLTPDPGGATERELPEAPDVLVLAEHRLDGLLAQAATASPPRAVRLRRHRRGERLGLQGATAVALVSLSRT